MLVLSPYKYLPFSAIPLHILFCFAYYFKLKSCITLVIAANVEAENNLDNLWKQCPSPGFKTMDTTFYRTIFMILIWLSLYLEPKSTVVQLACFTGVISSTPWWIQYKMQQNIDMSFLLDEFMTGWHQNTLRTCSLFNIMRELRKWKALRVWHTVVYHESVCTEDF